MQLKFSFCSLILLFCSIYAAVDWTCDKTSEAKLDDLMSQLLTFGTTRKYPEAKNDYKDYCKENYSLLKQIEAYNKKCLDTLSKQTIGLILYSMKSLIDSYCKKNSKYLEEMLIAAPCANKATKEFNKCHIQYIDSLIAGVNHSDRKLMIPVVCCDYHKIWDCVHSKGKKIMPECTERVLDISEDFVKAHFERVFNLLCADYGEQTDRCDKIPGLKKNSTKIKNNKRRPKTFILPLVELLKGLPEL